MNPDSTAALLIATLIIANGVLSLAEFAIISSRPTRLHELKDAGYEDAALVLKLTENPGKFLSAIQIGITLIGILTGAISGLSYSSRLADILGHYAIPEPYRHEAALAVVVAAVTYLSLVAGELLPKKIALQHPEAIALKIAPFIDLLCRVSAPVVHIVDGSTTAILKAFGMRTAEKPLVTDEDVMLLIRQGAKKGVFESVEYDMVSRIFRMSDKRASAIMTPRNEIEWLDLDDSDEELIARIKASGRSRFPVGEGSLDNLRGVVRALDLVNLHLSHPGSVRKSVMESMRAPLFVPESIPAFQVLEVFRKNKAHMALVIDERGSVEGAITLTDVLEGIVGELPADDLVVSRKIVRRSQRTWIVDGMLPVDDFAEAFHLDLEKFLEDEEPRYETMGGFIMDKLGEVPSVSDTLEWHRIAFRVIKMEGQRVARLLVELTAEDAGKIGREEARHAG